MSVDESDRRLVELETRLAFHEDSIQSLSDLLYSQQKQLDRLQHGFDLLDQRFQEVSQNEPGKVVDEPPPHY